MVSKNFVRKEFTCKCGCGFECVDKELVEILERVREYFVESWVVITSGNRCQSYNKKIGGAKNSKHISGIACDFQVFIKHKDQKILVSPIHVFAYLEKLSNEKWGIGRYSNRIHLDMREKKARWIIDGEDND
jgi:uncharacterized protein YcbK (DUF882 family)